jgi:hypothetical protein
VSKYGNVQTAAIDGKVFSSKREATRYAELKMLETMGKIVNLRLQVRYNLIPAQNVNGHKERAVDYVADFVYRSIPPFSPHSLHVEDTKGFHTKDYIIKRKLMLHIHGIRIEEI